MSQSKPAAAPQPLTKAQIALLKGPDRKAILEAGAAKEGKVKFYAVEFIDRFIDPLTKKFHEKYPNIQIDATRMETLDMTRRVLDEARGKKLDIDMAMASTEAADVWRDAGLLQEFNSPFVDDYPPAFRTPKGLAKEGELWVKHRQDAYVVGYNTKLVTGDMVPKSYQDLLKPQYKGKMAISDTSVIRRWFFGLLEVMGDEAGKQYLRQLAQQNIKVYGASVRALADLTASGETPITLGMAAHHFELVKATGAPVEWAFIEPFTSGGGALAVLKDAPRPHAGMLWFDFILDPEGGQKVFNDLKITLPTHPKMKMWITRLTGAKIHPMDDVAFTSRQKEIEQLTRELFIKK